MIQICTHTTNTCCLPARNCLHVCTHSLHSQVDQECRIFNNLSTLRQQVHSKRRMLGSYVLCLFSDDVSRTVVPKVCSMDPKGSASSSQGICGYTSVMATFKFTYIV